MQNSWVFICSSYQEALHKKVELEGNRRGYKAALARSAHCQPAYLSQVLGDHADLTLEQAAGLCDFWLLSELEAEYFLTLVEMARAGTPNLVKRLKQRLENLKNLYEAEKMQLTPQTSHPERAVNYYLDWSVSAVHIALSIPELADSKVIAKKLHIDESRVLKALTILQDLGIVTRKKNRWVLTAKNLHAADATLFANLHHKNWRDKVKDLLPAELSQRNFHYTSVWSLSREDFNKIREMAATMIAQAQEKAAASKEETLSCLTLDWFEL